MGLVVWIGFGAAVGRLAAQRRGFSLVTGVVAGLMLGPFAVALFYIPLSISTTGRQQKCPYCAGWVAADRRVCRHCGAILQSGWG